jgi:hypothetical protein
MHAFVSFKHDICVKLLTLMDMGFKDMYLLFMYIKRFNVDNNWEFFWWQSSDVYDSNFKIYSFK